MENIKSEDKEHRRQQEDFSSESKTNYVLCTMYYVVLLLLCFPPRKQERPLIEPGTPVTKGALEFLFVLPPFPLPSALPISLDPL